MSWSRNAEVFPWRDRDGIAVISSVSEIKRIAKEDKRDRCKANQLIA